MSLRKEQCNKVCRILDDVLANRPNERDSLVIATRKAFAGPQWIPCSEKLPENGYYYLWCSDGGNVQSDYYWDGFENGKKFGYNIIAWMPLPEPYKEDKDERD